MLNDLQDHSTFSPHSIVLTIDQNRLRLALRIYALRSGLERNVHTRSRCWVRERLLCTERRKLFAQQFQPSQVHLHHPAELNAARVLLQRLVETPEKYERHLRQ